MGFQADCLWLALRYQRKIAVFATQFIDETCFEDYAYITRIHIYL